MQRFRDAPIVVCGATLLHVVVGLMLLTDAAAARSTGPAAIADLFGSTLAGILMLTASALALIVIFRRVESARWSLLLLLPQQALLYLAAWGGLQAILEGQYADGVTRPYTFILTDQLPMMLFALIHTIAVLEIPWQTEAR
jgi:hypothetical protein